MAKDTYQLVWARDVVTGLDVMVDYSILDSSNEAVQAEVTQAYTNALGNGVCAWTEDTNDPWEDIDRSYEDGIKKTNLSSLTFFTIDDALDEIGLRAKSPERAQFVADLNSKNILLNPTEKQVRAAIEKAKAKAASQR